MKKQTQENKTQEAEAEAPKVNARKEIISQAVKIARIGSDYANSVVIWIVALRGLPVDQIFGLLDDLIKAYNRASVKIGKVGLNGLQDLRDNFWYDKRTRTGFYTRDIYRAYYVVVSLAGKQALKAVKGLQEFWHVEILEWINQVIGKEPKADQILPTVALVLVRLGEVLHHKDQREVQRKGWKTREQILRGLGSSRLADLVFKGEYKPRLEGETVSVTVGALLDRLIAITSYVISPENPLLDTFRLFWFGLLTEPDPQALADQLRAVSSMRDYEYPATSDLTVVLNKVTQEAEAAHIASLEAEAEVLNKPKALNGKPKPRSLAEAEALERAERDAKKDILQAEAEAEALNE